MVNNEFNGHVGIWPRTDQMPTYSIRSDYESCPREVSLRLAAGWSIHLPATADGGAYLRRLAAVISECADAVEERAARIER
jgi:hypothetical protein